MMTKLLRCQVKVKTSSSNLKWVDRYLLLEHISEGTLDLSQHLFPTHLVYLRFRLSWMFESIWMVRTPKSKTHQSWCYRFCTSAFCSQFWKKVYLNWWSIIFFYCPVTVYVLSTTTNLISVECGSITVNGFKLLPIWGYDAAGVWIMRQNIFNTLHHILRITSLLLTTY